MSQEAQEARGCAAVVVTGRLYLSNGDPGYPDEYCDNEALPGSDYCEDHEENEGDIDPDYIDPDLEFQYEREGRD